MRFARGDCSKRNMQAPWRASEETPRLRFRSLTRALITHAMICDASCGPVEDGLCVATESAKRFIRNLTVELCRCQAPGIFPPTCSTALARQTGRGLAHCFHRGAVGLAQPRATPFEPLARRCRKRPQRRRRRHTASLGKALHSQRLQLRSQPSTRRTRRSTLPPARAPLRAADRTCERERGQGASLSRRARSAAAPRRIRRCPLHAHGGTGMQGRRDAARAPRWAGRARLSP